MGKDLKETDGVLDVYHKGVDGQGDAESGPDVPVAIGGGGARRNDAALDGVLCSAIVTAESISGGGVQRRQD